MDPVGFALENFDAVGRWRDSEADKPVDESGGFLDRSKFVGVSGLEQALLNRPELFVRTLTEKLMTFALGRGIEYYDAPEIRKIVDDAPRPRLSYLADNHGHCPKCAVSNEDVEMTVKKIALPRRTFLRGTGAVLALPLLDAMIPSFTALANTPASPARLRRLGFVYMPMGCDVTRWTPPGKDVLDELSPSLSPLAPLKKKISIISNLELRNAYPGTHATSNASFLSAAKAKRTESTDYHLGTTVDQIAARELGRDTQLPSLELSMDLLSVVGQCDNGYACVYQNNLSWSSPTTPLPAEAHPRIVFENLFGEERDATERRAALRKRASLLDSVVEELTRLQYTLGPGDRNRVTQYLESVRDVERRIQRAEAVAAENPRPDFDRPLGVPASYADHARLMFDLQAAGASGRHHARGDVSTGSGDK